MAKQRIPPRPHYLPNTGITQLHPLHKRIQVVLQVLLRPHEVADELGREPDARVAMEPRQPVGQVGRDRQGEVGGPRTHHVDDGEGENLGVLGAWGEKCLFVCLLGF